jgi:hypothetical protein
MTQSVQSLIALGQSLGLQGFATSKAPNAEATDDRKPGAAALAAAQHAGLKDFGAAAEPSRRNESTMALAVRLGLPGFVEKSETPVAQDTPAPKPVAISPPMRKPPLPAAISPAMRKPTTPVAAAAPNHRFLTIDIAAGSTAAFSALESKMGQPFTPHAWLQRTNADGSQTRAYVTMIDQAEKLEAISGDLGSPSVRMSVGPISRSQFAFHTTSGPVPAGTRALTAFIEASVPVALRRALGR